MGWEALGELVRSGFQSERAAGLVEWGLLVVLIAVVALVAVQFAGDQNSVLWSEIASSVET
ncbi:MAG TPA: Flp family type IVb pilin [Acidimicrobiia bacterium]|jgi:Flp pilus assembly pilin Flp|nr:Flp family type IVb pilin [Acidimicrobiia bacterium]